MKKIVVVGAGFSGSVIARKIAEDLDRRVCVVEKRPHVGGNMYDEVDEHGVLVQKYGPHIICTNRYAVIEYLKKYAELFKHTVKLLSFIDGKYVRLPFNFETVQQLVGAKKSEILINRLRKEYTGQDRVPVSELVENSDAEISSYGILLFEKAYRNYCAKQWDIPVETIDKTVLDRVPMAMNYDERYMNKDFQYLPERGFTDLFRNILDHKNIHVSLADDALNHIVLNEDTGSVLYDGDELECLVFTGPIDELFKLKHGALPYRSLDIKYEYFNKADILPEQIISYPQADGYTRKTEYKKLMRDPSGVPGSLVATEYPVKYEKDSVKGGIPYYPVLTKETQAIYAKYLDAAKEYRNIFLCGRLAEFKYYNMDDCIIRAFDIFEDIKRKLSAQG
jgi:UDP-galactopyranose mutase